MFVLKPINDAKPEVLVRNAANIYAKIIQITFATIAVRISIFIIPTVHILLGRKCI